MKTDYAVSDLIEEVTRAHVNILARVNDELERLTEVQKSWKPAADQWSIVECLAHLNLSNTYYIRQIQKKTDDARRVEVNPGDKRFSMSANGKLMLKVLDPASKMKIPAPLSARPRSNPDPNAVFERFNELENLFLELVPQTAKLDLEQEKVISPFVSWLKFRVGDVLLFLTAHTQRHVNQAFRVMQAPNFPLT
ncbi:DinB family protein [Telluribacter sp.]|jgi:hypothetical protein|uniref:DinB family protein n=1 Tax=Telluribacter sp. TaxID=1978767 RepID=UPI002E0DBB0C|nr:DinB family protein [Telluribacter sp.]